MIEISLSRKQMTRLLENLSDVILIIDSRGVYRFVSSGQKELLYRSPEKIIGKRPDEVFDQENAAKFQQVVDEVFRSGEMVMIEYPLETGGEQRWFQGTASLLKGWEDGDDEEKYVLVVAHDITKRKMSELETERKQQDAEKAKKAAQQRLLEQQALAVRSDRFRSLGEMAAGMAHELNQPLSGIRVFAESIYLGLEQGWEVEKDEIIYKTKRIVEQADRMSSLVEHIHHFTREAEKPVTMPVDIKFVIDSTLMLVKARFRAHTIHLGVEMKAREPIVLANPFSLEEVLLSLLSNAFDALEVEPACKSPDEKKEVIIRVLEDKSSEPTVIIEVEDNGVGMTEEENNKIFDPFFTTKSPGRGVGLGMSVSKKIIENLGGSISVSSKLNRGTVVRIDLPEVNPKREAGL